MKKLLLALATFLMFCLTSPFAHADGLTFSPSENWTCSPVAAVTGFQYNVRLSTFQRGVSLGLGYGCRYTGYSVPLTIEAVGSGALNDNAPNAGQLNLIFVAADNYGIGPGTQIFRDPVTHDLTGQTLISGFLTGSWASTIQQFKQAKVEARREGLSEAGVRP